MKSFSIIGAGKVGVALGLALVNKGLRLKYISDCNPDAARRAEKLIKMGKTTQNNRLATQAAEISFICVPDGLIRKVVRELSELDLDGHYIFHTSGAVTSRVLRPLSRQGAVVASFHPIQTFATTCPDPDIFRGIFFSLEGDEKAIELGQSLAGKLQSGVILISPANKPLYHLACSMASNFMVVLLAEVKNLFELLGLDEKACLEVIYPLLSRTLLNVKELGCEQSLTGPILRGDLKTVKGHLKALSSQPDLEKLYRLMSLEALKMAEKRGLSASKVKALKRLLVQK
ncbi:MAG TPA: DUF2520 domain-containing protein [Candidatus Saccharicenans sp.]|nr:DUF2520 domain-containing protein [Candidatus Saccharicenans sp.]HOM93755.1 DUF2520 domain-containing protein [Candidatus Saccharicenans sp.]HOT68942.1 DUF2520 domain-containing protein [Candidatus Saccharicenans sp.]HQH60866.1 DUF2520 domain-containing protein [Candidatus Saccharicenans sp.]HQI22721.1 DUF2520 domain-containing protein [Candidatus Saccharicenans sp.]